MTGTSAACLHTNQSRSYLNHLVLFSHLLLGLPSCLFPSGFPTKTLYTPLAYAKLNTVLLKLVVFLSQGFISALRQSRYFLEPNL